MLVFPKLGFTCISKVSLSLSKLKSASPKSTVEIELSTFWLSTISYVFGTYIFSKSKSEKALNWISFKVDGK